MEHVCDINSTRAETSQWPLPQDLTLYQKPGCASPWSSAKIHKEGSGGYIYLPDAFWVRKDWPHITQKLRKRSLLCVQENRSLWGRSVDPESMGQSHALHTINKRQNLNYNVIILLRIFVAIEWFIAFFVIYFTYDHEFCPQIQRL